MAVSCKIAFACIAVVVAMGTSSSLVLASPGDPASPSSFLFVLQSSGATMRVPIRLDAELSRSSNATSRDLHDVVPGADMHVRPVPGGWEDRTVFHRRPSKQRLRYRVDVREVGGLRLVEGTNVVEFLDEAGAPRVRMAASFWWHGDALDAPDDGIRRSLQVRILDCAYDTSPAPPWGRPVVGPGNDACTLEVGWSSDRYPVVVDPVWTTTSAMTVARTHHASAALPGDRALVVGGEPLGFESTAEIWDGSTGTWAMTSPPSYKMYSAGAVLLADGRVLAIEQDGSDEAPLLFDPDAGIWSATPPMTQSGTTGLLLLLAGGRVVAVGGGFNESSSCELYDPSSGQWTAGTPMNESRYAHAGALLSDGRVLVAGGQDASSAFLDTAEIYDPVQDTWQPTSKMPGTRRLSRAVRLQDGRILVAGGESDSGGIWPELRTDLFDPTTHAWSAGPELSYARVGHTMTLLPNGGVLLVGGGAGTGIRAASVFLPDAGGGSLHAVGDLVDSRVNHAAVPLAHGRVLVTGGGTGAPALASAEVFGLLANGQHCESRGECESTHCVDGVCCDSACDSPCRACSIKAGSEAEDGACAPIQAGLDPEQECPETGTCGFTGVCDGEGACETVAAGTPCGEPSCAGIQRRDPVCDGAGSCVPVDTSCDGHLICDPSVNACLTACRDDADCVQGAACVSGACVLPLEQGATCGPATVACVSSLVCVEGTCCDTQGATGCGVYRCSSAGVCLNACEDSGDCVAGARCDGSGRCSLAPVEKSAGGCACGASPGRTRVGLGIWIGAILIAVGIRRSRSWIPASLLLMVLLAPGIARADKADKSSEQSAREMFRRGQQLIERGDLEGALDWFLRSRAAMPSISNTINAASCLARLERSDEAVELYQDVLLRFSDPRNAQDIEMAKRAIEELRAVMGEVVVDTNVAGQLVIDGRLRGEVPREAPVLVNAGERTFRLVAPEYETEDVRAEVPARGRIVVTFEAKPIVRERVETRTRTVVREVTPPRWRADLVAGWGWGSSIGSDMGSCDGCSEQGGVNAQVGALRVSYALGSALRAEASGGVLRVTQAVRRTIPHTNGTAFELDEDVSLLGPWIGLGMAGEVRLVDELRGVGRLTVMGWVAATKDEASATIVRDGESSPAVLEGSGEVSRALNAALWPELGLEWAFGRWRVGGGMAAGYFLVPGPRLPLGETVPELQGACPPGTTELSCAPATTETANEPRAYDSFLLFVPSVWIGMGGW